MPVSRKHFSGERPVVRTAARFLLLLMCVPVILLAQAPAPGQPAAAAQPATEATTPEIPGVVAAGTKVELVKGGFKSVEGPTSGPDGSLVFTDMQGNQLWKVDKDGNVTSFLETANSTGSI